MHYREGSNLTVMADDKSTVPRLWCGYDRRLHDSSQTGNTWNRAGDLLGQAPGDPKLASLSSI